MPVPKLETPKVDPPKVERTDDLVADERWQLVQRIVSSPPFQKSVRLRELLEYLAKRTIHGHAHELSEQHIGNVLFHKPSGYSSLEDSSVRSINIFVGIFCRAPFCPSAKVPRRD